jgi:hypothetical protein
MKATKVARKLRIRIGRFSGELSKGVCLPAQRFVSEMVYGIQAARSVMLTEVGSSRITPLFQRLYSAEAPDFVSENEEILGAVDIPPNTPVENARYYNEVYEELSLR